MITREFTQERKGLHWCGLYVMVHSPIPSLAAMRVRCASPSPKRFGTTYLDLLVEQVQGQVLKRDPSSGVGAGMTEQVWDISGIPGLAPRMNVLEGLEVIVQRVPHHHLALQELEDL